MRLEDLHPAEQEWLQLLMSRPGESCDCVVFRPPDAVVVITDLHSDIERLLRRTIPIGAPQIP